MGCRRDGFHPPPPARKVWAYVRTSTDDKGQDPLRQLDRIKPWCPHENLQLLGHSIDEGASGLKTSPFERDGFIHAIDRARDTGCTAIVCETGDRFTRKGTRHFWAYIYLLEERHNLKIWFADETLVQQNSAIGEVIATIKAMAANEWIENHRAKVVSGMARKRCKLQPGHVKGPDCNGSHFGHPSKIFSHAEMELVWTERRKTQPLGWRTLTLRINRERKCFEMSDEQRRRKIMVSSVTVRRLYANLERAKSISLPAPPAITSEVAA